MSFILQIQIMDPQRTKKARSLGIDSNPSKQPTSTSTTSKRPDLGDRHYSAPSVARRRQSETKRNSDTADKTRRGSKAGCRDDPFRPTTIFGQLQHSEQYRTSAYPAKSNIKVCLILVSGFLLTMIARSRRNISSLIRCGGKSESRQISFYSQRT